MRRKPASKRSHAGDSLENDVRLLLWPIVKRLPGYARLAWALMRDPEIPARHKVALSAAVLYTVSPLQWIGGMVPVVGQIDSIVFLLLGLQSTLRHAPPAVAKRHLEQLGIPPRQLNKDLHVTVWVAVRTVGRVGTPLRRNVTLAGRLAYGFGKRVVRRATAKNRATGARRTARALLSA